MSDIQFRRHRVFRETDSVIFYDISVEESNASDLVIHTGPAISPPPDCVGGKQFYIHSKFQEEYRLVDKIEKSLLYISELWEIQYHNRYY